MIRKHRTKEKRRFAALLMALAVLLASPPNLKAQSTDVYFESQGFGSGYAYGFSHEGFGNDLIYNFSHQIYGDDYIYNFTHEIFGRDYTGEFSHENFGDDFTGNFGHQGFGDAPMGSGIFILLAAGTCYAVKRRQKSGDRRQKSGDRRQNPEHRIK